MSSIKTERYYYPNGQLRGECSLENGKLVGTTRKWHDNSVLSWESPFSEGLQHGVIRQWNREGKLLGEYRMDHGTGISKSWYANGQLENEAASVHGRLHGRFRCWLEDGELISETYHILDKQVSKKKYDEACKSDPSLPRYEDNKSKPKLSSAKHQRKTLVSDEIREQHNKFIAEFRAQPNQAEARQWLSVNGNRNLGEMTPEESLQVIEDGYKAGAIRITAVDIQDETTNCLLVDLPSKGLKRERVFEWNNELAQESGFDPDDDWGQEELFVFFS
jgi:MORN repeat protein